jgi:hypothetical protein
MPKPFFRGRTLAVGLLSALLFVGCEEAEPEAECTDDDCEEQPADGKGGKPKPDDKSSDDDDDDTPVAPGKGDAGQGKPVPKPNPMKDGGTDPKANPPAAGALPCDVKAVVTKYCGTCHGEDPSSPMSLVTVADFKASNKAGKKYVDLVKELINESDVTKRMPPASVDPLPADGLKTLNAWLDKGAPAATGTESCKPTPDMPGNDTGFTPDDQIDTSDLKCEKFLAHDGNKGKFKVGVQRDGYFNFTFVPSWKQTVYGMVVRPVIDNKPILHHWLLFQDNVPGTATGGIKSIGAHPAGQLLHGWAPGGHALNTRDAGDVGIELPATSYTVEFHYNSEDANALDASGLEICYSEKKPAQLAGLSWLGIDQLGIPAQKWTGVCRPSSQEPIRIFGVNPHMHKTGRHMKATINRKDGKKEILHDMAFDFDFQISYRKDVTLMPGDTITTECTFSQPMAFGEGTNAEMCYLFTMAYPKGALASPDIWGTIAHGGSSCLGM